MTLTERLRNPKVRLLLSGAAATSRVALLPLFGVETALSSRLIEAGVTLSRDLLGSALYEDTSESSPFYGILNDKQVQRAIHSAICAIIYDESKTIANSYYERELVKLSKTPFKVWEDYLKYPAPNQELPEEKNQILDEVSEENFKELLYFADASSDGVPLLNRDEWYSFLTYIESQAKIELIVGVKERVAESLEQDFLPYLRKAVAEDQRLVNGILIEYVTKAQFDSQILLSILQKLPKATADEIRRMGLIDAGPSSPRLDLPPLTNFFTGRKLVLENLRKELTDSGSASLHGMFGIGKTSVSLRYAYQFQDDYDQVIFIRASQSNLHQRMANVARAFDPQRVDMLEKVEEKAAFLRKILDDPSRWSRVDRKYLLILDNVEDAEQVRSLVPSNKQGHIILTANDRNISGIANNVEIHEIELGDGKLLLFRRKGADPKLSSELIPVAEDPLLEEIVVALGCSPLAINIAGAYLFSTQASLTDYLELIETADILEDEDKSDPYHNKTILKAFEISYIATCSPEHNTRESNLIAEAAMHMIHGSVFISPYNIPEELLRKYLLRQGTRFQKVLDSSRIWMKARQKAIQYDLLRYDDSTGMYWTHSLIQMNIQRLFGW